MCYCKEPTKPMWRHTDECCWSPRLDSLFEPRHPAVEQDRKVP